MPSRGWTTGPWKCGWTETWGEGEACASGRNRSGFHRFREVGIPFKLDLDHRKSHKPTLNFHIENGLTPWIFFIRKFNIFKRLYTSVRFERAVSFKIMFYGHAESRSSKKNILKLWANEFLIRFWQHNWCIFFSITISALLAFRSLH